MRVIMIPGPSGPSNSMASYRRPAGPVGQESGRPVSKTSARGALPIRGKRMPRRHSIATSSSCGAGRMLREVEPIHPQDLSLAVAINGFLTRKKHAADKERLPPACLWTTGTRQAGAQGRWGVPALSGIFPQTFHQAQGCHPRYGRVSNTPSLDTIHLQMDSGIPRHCGALWGCVPKGRMLP